MKRKKLMWIGSAYLVLLIWVGVLSKTGSLAPALQKLPLSSVMLGPPKGDISVYDYAQLHPGSFFSIFPKQEISLAPFPLASHTQVSSELMRVSFPEAFVVEVPHGRIYGRNGAVITDKDLVLSETSSAWIHTMGEHAIFRKVKLPALKKTSERIALIAAKSPDSYFHWLFEVLPRLELLRLSQIPYDKICLNIPKFAFQQESLELFDINPEEIIWAKKEIHMEAETLIVPSLLWSRQCSMPQWVCAFLRKKFLAESSSEEPKKRLYISREDAATRHIVNEEELMKYLAPLGFEKYTLNHLSISEQAQLFASAECVVGPHGAGLSNIVFCTPGAKVLEIFSPDYINECFWLLSHQSGLKHRCLFGKKERLSPQELLQNDVYVTAEEVASQVASLLEM